HSSALHRPLPQRTFRAGARPLSQSTHDDFRRQTRTRGDGVNPKLRIAAGHIHGLLDNARRQAPTCTLRRPTPNAPAAVLTVNQSAEPRLSPPSASGVLRPFNQL